MLKHTTAFKQWVTMRMRLSLCQPKTTSVQKIDWEAFASDCDQQARYTIHVKNRSQILEQEESNSDCYQRFTEANTEAGETH